MPTVFDGSNRTMLRVKDPITDDTLPPPGALNWEAIASESGLTSTTGVDCKKVTGNRWQQITGNMTENFTGNVSTKIIQNQIHNVLANQTLQTVGNVNHTVIGNLTSTVMSAESETRLGPVNRLFAAPRVSTWAAADQIQKSGGTEYESKDMDLENIGTQQQNIGFSTVIFVVQFQLIMTFLLQLVQMNCTLNLVDLGASAVKAWEKGADAEVTGVRGEVRGVKADAAGGQASAAPRVNAAPDVGVGTPVR